MSPERSARLLAEIADRAEALREELERLGAQKAALLRRALTDVEDRIRMIRALEGAPDRKGEA